VRAEDVQRIVQEALAAERAQQAARQEQAPIPEPAPVVEQQVQEQAQDAEYERYSRCLARFQKARPPPFGGEPDPDLTDAWVMEMEKIFKSLRCPREFWVELAAYTFTRAAEHWWRGVRDQFGERGDWEKFLTLFNARFLPEPVLRQKEEEFNKLLQGSRPVWEYHADFVMLARYATHLRDDEPRLACPVAHLTELIADLGDRDAERGIAPTLRQRRASGIGATPEWRMRCPQRSPMRC
jgi:hypothetical protein